MATGEQIRSLIKAHYDRDDERFKTAALRIAAGETKCGHTALGREIMALVDTSSKRAGIVTSFPNKDGLFDVSMPKVRMADIVVSEELVAKIDRMLREYRQRNRLASYGLSCRRKVLLEGRLGTGKTMTASVLASELSLPLYTVRIDKLITKHLGETSARLRQIFDCNYSVV